MCFCTSEALQSGLFVSRRQCERGLRSSVLGYEKSALSRGLLEKFSRSRPQFFGVLAQVSQKGAPFFLSAPGDVQIPVRKRCK